MHPAKRGTAHTGDAIFAQCPSPQAHLHGAGFLYVRLSPEGPFWRFMRASDNQLTLRLALHNLARTCLLPQVSTSISLQWVTHRIGGAVVFLQSHWPSRSTPFPRMGRNLPRMCDLMRRTLDATAFAEHATIPWHVQVDSPSHAWSGGLQAGTADARGEAIRYSHQSVKFMLFLRCAHFLGIGYNGVGSTVRERVGCSSHLYGGVMPCQCGEGLLEPGPFNEASSDIW